MATDVSLQSDFLASNPIFQPAMVIKALRDSRYRHPVNAIAELIDNSIDANASQVELLVKAAQVPGLARSVQRIQKIAILDNGEGMSPETLSLALSFGGHKPLQSIKNIGKYGMGLPTSSASQCKKLDVWSWQDGPDSSYHAYLSIDEVEAGQQSQIFPDQQPIPQEWLQLAKQKVGSSGTLVVWSDIDRITIKPDTVFRHIEEEIGRIYRHYINSQSLTIRMASFQEPSESIITETQVRPNDPLYLMETSNTPGEWGSQPMFDLLRTQDFPVIVDGKEETVTVTYSLVKSEPLGNHRDLPGQRDYGQHANKNMGVSVIRENREITLDRTMATTDQGGGAYPLNRWWGCEVKFNEGCDDLFGVDHNKQTVSHFVRALRDLNLSDSGDTEARDETDGLETDLYGIAEDIRNTIRYMMREIQRKFSQRPRLSNPIDAPSVTTVQKAEEMGTQAIEEALRNLESDRTPTDDLFDTVEDAVKIEELTKDLTNSGLPLEEAQRQAQITVERRYRYKFINASLSGYAVFEVETSQSGVLVVKLNINHPAYDYLEFLENQAGSENNEQDSRPASALRLIILALARMEDEIQDQRTRVDFQDTCRRWGRILSRLIDEGVINTPE